MRNRIEVNECLLLLLRESFSCLLVLYVCAGSSTVLRSVFLFPGSRICKCKRSTGEAIPRQMQAQTKHNVGSSPSSGTKGKIKSNQGTKRGENLSWPGLLLQPQTAILYRETIHSMLSCPANLVQPTHGFVSDVVCWSVSLPLVLPSPVWLWYDLRIICADRPACLKLV